ncbi:hypothetical protein B0H19DRAFT_1175500 [Mycena capillaripes]|nr:hypothetical protein B0H19DRAFT_1175500 [Mycena capillaripes]
MNQRRYTALTQRIAQSVSPNPFLPSSPHVVLFTSRDTGLRLVHRHNPRIRSRRHPRPPQQSRPNHRPLHPRRRTPRTHCTLPLHPVPPEACARAASFRSKTVGLQPPLARLRDPAAHPKPGSGSGGCATGTGTRPDVGVPACWGACSPAVQRRREHCATAQPAPRTAPANVHRCAFPLSSESRRWFIGVHSRTLMYVPTSNPLVQSITAVCGT